MKRHQDSFKTQSETGRNGDKIDTHNTHIHDHSLCSMQDGDVVSSLNTNANLGKCKLF